MVAGQQPLVGHRADAWPTPGLSDHRLAGRPGYVELTVGRADPLAQVVPALPIAASVDLDAAPVGVCEDGTPWRLRLGGSRPRRRVHRRRQGSVLWS
jgi:S-DNA-T family DNA segregation ATPase FtsK/SpoIIIE